MWAVIRLSFVEKRCWICAERVSITVVNFNNFSCTICERHIVVANCARIIPAKEVFEDVALETTTQRFMSVTYVQHRRCRSVKKPRENTTVSPICLRCDIWQNHSSRLLLRRCDVVRFDELSSTGSADTVHFHCVVFAHKHEFYVFSFSALFSLLTFLRRSVPRLRVHAVVMFLYCGHFQLLMLSICALFIDGCAMLHIIRLS